MNLRIYEKTRYQNIYRHIKNKNYLVMISKPVKSSISSIDGKKIFKLEDALKIRDNPKLKQQKAAEIIFKDGFDELWDKYNNYCTYNLKLEFNTQDKKNCFYKRYFKDKLPKPSKTTKEYIAKFIDNLECSDKQKNEAIRILKAFYNWCIDEEIILTNPLRKIVRYKTVKKEMKYWQPENLEKFFVYINDNLNEYNSECEVLYRIKLVVMLCFVLGDRIGETRALTYNSINELHNTININHSIEYDTKKENFIKYTKTESSQRILDVSQAIINEVKKYRWYLLNVVGYDVEDNDLIFFNYKTKKPFSDTLLRKEFYKICELAEVPKIRLYDLRHTYTVIALNYDGYDMWAVSNKLGHSNIRTTINTYNHMTNKIKKEMANSTDKYIQVGIKSE